MYTGIPMIGKIGIFSQAASSFKPIKRTIFELSPAHAVNLEWYLSQMKLPTCWGPGASRCAVCVARVDARAVSNSFIKTSYDQDGLQEREQCSGLPGTLLIREWADLPGKPWEGNEGWPTHEYRPAWECRNETPPEARSWGWPPRECDYQM